MCVYDVVKEDQSRIIQGLFGQMDGVNVTRGHFSLVYLYIFLYVDILEAVLLYSFMLKGLILHLINIIY